MDAEDLDPDDTGVIEDDSDSDAESDDVMQSGLTLVYPLLHDMVLSVTETPSGNTDPALLNESLSSSVCAYCICTYCTLFELACAWVVLCAGATFFTVVDARPANSSGVCVHVSMTSQVRCSVQGGTRHSLVTQVI